MSNKLSLKGVNELTIKGRMLSYKLQALVVTDDEIEDIANKSGKTSLLPFNYQKRTNSALEKAIAMLQLKERKVGSQELKEVLSRIIKILREIDRVVFESPVKGRLLDYTFETSLEQIFVFIDEYEHFDNSGLETEDVLTAKHNILDSFNRFLTYLSNIYGEMYRADTMSANSDVKAFNQILTMNSVNRK